MSEEQKKPQAENETVEADTIFGAAPQTAAAPASKKVSNNWKALIAGGIALIVLGAGMTAVLLSNKQDAKNPSDEELLQGLTDEDEAASILLNPGVTADVKEIHLVNTDDFTIVRVAAAEEEDGKPLYTIKGLTDVPLDNNLLYTLANNGSELDAVKLVEEHPADLSKYGLAEPTAEVTLSYDDGSVFTMQIGDYLPMDTTKTYCGYDGDVYLVTSSKLANYSKTSGQLMSSTILAEPAQADYPIIDAVRIQRKDLDWDIYLEYDYEGAEDTSVGGTAATHVLLEPIFSYLNVERSADVTNGIFGLSAEEAAIVHPTEADFHKTGLDDPFCTVTVQCDNGTSYTLTIGDTYETDGGVQCYYTYLDGVNVIYGVTPEEDVWATVQPGDITSANIIATYVWDIAELKITGADKVFDFQGEGTEQSDYTVTKNGEACDTERFRQLYRFLLNIYGEEVYIGDLPSGKPDAEVQIVSQDGREDYTISFYQVSDLKTIVARDGVPSYSVRTSALNTLLYNLDIFDDAEQEFRTTWQ